ncbi:MAG: hypothetical protein CMN84_08685 [Spongiibacteraceae bacterium]|nr:hypothetical protein [Spongiibacteraceae bacterium]
MSHAYHISEDQFVRACWHAHRPLRLRLTLALFVVLALFPPVVGFTAASISATAIVAVLLIGFRWGLLPRIHGWRFRRTYRDNPLIQREQQLEMNPTGFVLSSSNGESRYAFRELKKVSVLEDMVLVYPTTTLFHMIPTALLSDFELAQFRALA